MKLDRIVRVDMTTGTITEETAPAKYDLLGGRALTAQMLLDETDARVHPLAPAATLFIAPGLLGGTALTTSGRTSFGFKSPLTGGTKEANVGGQLGHRLARLGIKAIVVTGESRDGWKRLDIDRDGVRLSPADELAGRSNYDLHRDLVGEALRTRAAATIGPAGEHRMAAASVAVTDPEGRPTRHAARGGPGAVMGAKGLKAIVVDDDGAQRVLNGADDGFKQEVVKFSKVVLEDPRTHNLSKYGTAGVVKFVNRDNVQSMPTRNHRHGRWSQADTISGQYIDELGQTRGGKMLPCMAGCVIKCAILFNNEAGDHVTTAFEFETIALLGSNLEIGPADRVAELDRLCDDVGLDTIEVGNAIGVAMEAGVLDWGDWEATRRILDVDIRQATPLGRIIGNGTAHVARTFGIPRVPVVKGQGLPAWEPRTLKGMGITYSTSPQGADHTAGMVTARGATPETLVKQSRHEQLVMMAIDSVGVCQFSNALPGDMASLIRGRFGVDIDDEQVLAMARRAIDAEREFNRRAGFTRDDDRLPAWLREEALELPDGPMAFDIDDELIDRVWAE